MKSSRLTKQVTALGLMALGILGSQAITIPTTVTESLTFNFTVTEQATTGVGVNAYVYDRATVTRYAFGNRDMVNFLESLTGLTFSSTAKLVLDGNFNIAIVDGESTANVSDYFHWENSFSVYTGQTIDTPAVNILNYNHSSIGYLDIYGGESSDYLYFVGRTTEPYTWVFNKSTSIGTETDVQITSGHGEGRIDGANVIFSGNMIYRNQWRGND